MESFKEIKDYLKLKYQVYAGRADLYSYFIEKGISLLKKNGKFGIIVSNKWMRANYGQPLRVLLKKKRIEEIIDFGELPVFKNTTTYPSIITIANSEPQPFFKMINVDHLEFHDLESYVQERGYAINQSDLTDQEWTLGEESKCNLLKKLNTSGIPLVEYADGKICWGIKTGLNEAFVISKEIRDQLVAKNPRNSEILKPFLTGKDITRYHTNPRQVYIIYTYHGINIEKFPEVIEYLKPFKEKLVNRATNQNWYELQQPQLAYTKFMEVPKIILPTIVKKASYAYDNENYYSNDKTSFIPTDDLYLLGILNSKLSDYVLFSIASTKQGGYFEYKPMYISKIPIRTINFSDPVDKARHDRIVTLVTQMLDLNKKLQDARLEQERTMLFRQIEATDSAIDRLVYELYRLTEEEIKVVAST